MDNIERVMCNRLVFAQAIGLYLNTKVELSENFLDYLKVFAVDNVDVYYRELYKIMFWKFTKNHNIEFVEPDNISELCEKYNQKLYDPKKLCEVYDKVGDEETEVLTDFAGVFINYVMTNNNSNSKYKQ